MPVIQSGSKRKHVFPAAMLLAAGLVAMSTLAFAGGQDGGVETGPGLGLSAAGKGFGVLSDGLAAEIGLATTGNDRVDAPGTRAR